MGDKKSLRADNYFAIIPEWVLYADISSNAVRLYGVLARYADKESGDCFPSRATISSRSGLSDALISKATKELVDLGALRVHRRKLENGGWASNLYTILSTNPTPSAEIVEGVLLESQNPSAEIDPSPSAEIEALTRVTINQSQLTKERKDDPPFFEAFFKAYPRRDDRAKAVKAYVKAVKKATPQEIFLGAERYAADPNRDPAYTKLAATWLNNECWSNPPLPGKSKPKGQTFLENFRNERKALT